MLQQVGACVLLFIALVHSVLGEIALLRPLFAASWRLDGLGRFAATRILRFVWHAATLSWIALAALYLGLPIDFAVAGFCLLTAALIFFLLRGHLAWPVFLFAGLAILRGGGHIPETLVATAALIAAALATVLAGIHVYWVLGGESGKAAALPTVDGEPVFSPGAAMTFLVALLLLIFAGLIVVSRFGIGPAVTRYLLMAAIAALVLRALGDGKYAGFSKRIRTGTFARLDDALYTPLVVGLAFGAGAALL